MSVRLSAARVRRVRSQLSQRDEAVLADVARVRLLSAGQIERLHFCDGTDLSRARRARRTLKRLHERGLLKRLERRVGGVYAGSAGFIYALDTLGQAVLEVSGPAGGRRRRRPWEPSAHFVDHILEVAEIYVTLREHERLDTSVEVLTFETEPSCWRRFSWQHHQVTLKPDAFVRLGVGDFEQVSFVEVDRGTEHGPTLKRKLAAYTAAFDAGVEQRDQVAFPNVLWIVPDQRRVNQLAQLIDRLPERHCALFTVTTPQRQLEPLKGGTT